MSYIGNTPLTQAQRDVQVQTVTATTTYPVSYTVGFLEVILNGSTLAPSEYTANDGLTLVLNSATEVGDSLVTVAWSTFATANTSSVVEDRFTGGGTGFTMSLIPTSKNNILVIVDGVPQGIDAYSVSGTTLTLTEAAADVVVVKHLGVPYTLATVPLVSVGEAELQVSDIQIAGLIPTAWCVFDGTITGTNAPDDDIGIASVTYNGVGDYTITFDTAMDNTDFSIEVSHICGTATYVGLSSIISFSTTSVNIKTYEWNTGSGSSAAITSPAKVNISFYGGKA